MSLSLGRLHMILTNVYPVESAYAQKDDSKNLKLPHNYILLCEFIALSKISEKELFWGKNIWVLIAAKVDWNSIIFVFFFSLIFS